MTRLDKIAKRAEFWQTNRRPRRAAQLADDVPWLLEQLEKAREEMWAARCGDPIRKAK